MVSNRTRANRSLGTKISAIDKATAQAQSAAALASATPTPGTNTVGTDAIQPSAVGGNEVARGSIGTDHLGVVNAINSDSNLQLALPGKINLYGASYPPPAVGTSALVVDSNGNIVISSGGAGSSITFSDTAPAGPSGGAQWFCTLDGTLYTYYVDINSGQWVEYGIQSPEPNSIPAGSILSWAGSTAPSNFLLCDGSAVSRTTYASLFQVVGTTYGVGDGSTTFNVPDLRDLVNWVSLGMTAAQNTASGGVQTDVTWDLERADLGNLHSTSTNTNRVTVAKAGRYRVTAQLQAHTTTTYVTVGIAVNGTAANYTTKTVPGTTNNFANGLAVATFDLNANDYITIQASSSTATAIDVANSMFQVEYVGPDENYLTTGPYRSIIKYAAADVPGDSALTTRVGAIESGRDAAWTAFTPTWSGGVTTPAIGNGTWACAYKLIGAKTVAIRISLTFGSTTNGGTGAWSFGLPSTLKGQGTEQELLLKAFVTGSSNYAGFAYIGAGSSTISPYLPSTSTTSAMALVQNAASGGATGTGVPVVASNFTFTTGSNLQINGVIEIQ